ncbi:photosynthetic reaction center cytochrome c subunit [Sulfitobacter sp. BDSS02]|nr:photosynthetic reaction center cytochrome c subunit [Sulfitobacter sp. BDSS02]MBR9849611.1 photosynthetic reaction center cytochrome c subunit [Paracoccaceae bacterium]
MFSWFTEWNKSHPVDVYRPAILVGVVGGGVFVATMLVAWGQPFATKSLQTGPRGTGMSVPEFVADLATPDPTIDDYYSDSPYPPEGGEALAGDVYQNVQVLGALTEDNFNRLMLAITMWVSPDQGCAYCHGDGDLETYSEDNLYTKIVSRRMIQMTQNINENWDGHVNANKVVGVNCYTCHRGQNVPSGIWFQSTPTVTNMAGWSANQNYVTPVSQYTSLPSDALETYLAEYGNIKVHDLESRVAGIPGQDDYPGIQNAERTFSLMNYFSNSLGVNCTFCHNSRAFYDTAQITPQWATATLGIALVQELNIEYLMPLQDVYPPERLGPLHGDAPKAACNTCHKGYQQPMQGLNVIENYPELATSGEPVYE